MNYNPYAAPQDAPQLQGGPPFPGAPGQSQPWTPTEALSLGWNAFKPNWVVLSAAVFVGYIPNIAGQVISQILQRQTYNPMLNPLENLRGSLGVTYGIAFIEIIIGAFFQVGWLRMFCAAARGQPLSFGMLFSGFDRYFQLLATNLLIVLGMYIGICFCCFPGVFLGLALGLAAFFVVDQKMGPIDALKASWNATVGQKVDIFVFCLLAICVTIAGVLACGVGIFAAIPVLGIAMAVIYMRIAGIAPNVAPPGGSAGGPFGPPMSPTSPMGQPPGGYGPPPGYGAPPGGGYGGPPA